MLCGGSEYGSLRGSYRHSSFNEHTSTCMMCKCCGHFLLGQDLINTYDLYCILRKFQVDLVFQCCLNFCFMTIACSVGAFGLVQGIKFTIVLFFSSTMGPQCYIFSYNACAASSSCAEKPFVSSLWFPLRATFFEAATPSLIEVTCAGRKFLCSLCSSSMWF